MNKMRPGLPTRHDEGRRRGRAAAILEPRAANGEPPRTGSPAARDPHEVLLGTRKRGRPGWLRWVAALALLLVLGAVGLRLATTQPPPPPVATPSGVEPVVARGKVQPVNHARIGTLAGGAVVSLSVQAGDLVREEQEIARVRSPNGTEAITAPWSGTITGVPVRLGDTVLPGAVIATIGDLSRLRVETTDLDEFMVGRVRVGQRVTVTVDALDDRPLRGYVHSLALQPEVTGVGDEHYPAVIELVETPPDLHIGMSVRVHFEEVSEATATPGG